MKTITIKNLSIQFDGNSTDSPLKQAQEALELINITLQREPYGLGAQILSSGLDNSDVETEGDLQINGIRETGSSRTGRLSATYKEIVDKIGKPNVTDMDDESKVKASWGFKDNEGRKSFIWCYKYPSAESCENWSVDGDKSLLKELFGENNIS